VKVESEYKFQSFEAESFSLLLGYAVTIFVRSLHAPIARRTHQCVIAPFPNTHSTHVGFASRRTRSCFKKARTSSLLLQTTRTTLQNTRDRFAL
jgi:hypothetical protein